MGSGKGGGGGGRASGRSQGTGGSKSSEPYPENANTFVEKLPGNLQDYVRFDISSREGMLHINIDGDKLTNPDNGTGEYILDHAGAAINDKLQGSVFIEPSNAQIRAKKDELLDKAYDSRKLAETSRSPGIHLAASKELEAASKKIANYERADSKTVSRGISAKVVTEGYIHKSRLESIKKGLRYQEYEG